MKAVTEAVLGQSPVRQMLSMLTPHANTQSVLANIPTCQALSTSFFPLWKKRKLVFFFSFFLSVVAIVAHGPWLDDKHIPGKEKRCAYFRRQRQPASSQRQQAFPPSRLKNAMSMRKMFSSDFAAEDTILCKVGSGSSGSGKTLKKKPNNYLSANING